MPKANSEEVYRVRLDSRRRLTLPIGLFADAGIDPAYELVARVAGHGRVVLESPLVLFASFQLAVAKGKETHGVADDLVNDLLADRSADTAAST